MCHVWIEIEQFIVAGIANEVMGMIGFATDAAECLRQPEAELHSRPMLR